MIRGAVIAAVAAAAALPAAAAAAPCRPDGTGPDCRAWTGRVTFVADGDTVDVNLRGDGTARPVRVRMVGIQAMEMTRYSRYRSRRRGDCHAVAATNRLEDVVRAARRRVRVLAQDPRSRARTRLRRLLQVRRGGRWADVAEILLREGHVLWDPGHAEWAMNGIHFRAAQQGAASGRRLYDPDTCRTGPSQSAPLRLRVNWDAAGNDHANPNGEWVRVRNDGGAAVAIGGWWIRDSAFRRFTFPARASIPAGGAVTLYVGRGDRAGTTFHWGLSAPAFENVSGAPRHMGDGAYLFDPHGDLRAWDLYGG